MKGNSFDFQPFVDKIDAIYISINKISFLYDADHCYFAGEIVPCNKME